MLGGNRREKVENLVRSVLSELVLTKLKDSTVGFLTITRVRMGADLRNAKVFYTVLNSHEENNVEVILNASAAYFQHALAKQVKLKSTPKLTFHEDKGIDDSLRIESILHELEQARIRDNEQEKK